MTTMAELEARGWDVGDVVQADGRWTVAAVHRAEREFAISGDGQSMIGPLRAHGIGSTPEAAFDELGRQCAAALAL